MGRTSSRSELFREVNDRIRELSRSWEPDEPVGFFCECDDATCTAPLELLPAEYDAIRAVPDQLVLVRGHVSGDIAAANGARGLADAASA